jgi:hypothetical protein
MLNSKENVYLPRGMEKLLYLILPSELRDPLMGDLHEEFGEQVVPRYGPSKARWWYRRQVLKSIRYYIFKKRGDIMFFLLSVLVFIGLSVLAGLMGSGLRMIINLPSLIGVIVPSFIFALAATSFQSWKRCLKLLLLNLDGPSKKEVFECSRFLKVFGNMCVIMGGYFSLLGIIQLLTGIDFRSANSEVMYHAFSVALIALFYGIALKSIFYVADQRLQNKFLDEY